MAASATQRITPGGHRVTEGAVERYPGSAALGQRADDASTSRHGMPAVLLEHEGEVLPDELRTRDAAFAGGTRPALNIKIACRLMYT